MRFYLAAAAGLVGASLLAFAGLLTHAQSSDTPAIRPAADGSAQVLVAAVAEDANNAQRGAYAILEQAGFECVPFDWAKPATEQGADVIFLGTFHAGRGTYTNYMRDHAGSIRAFAEAGGVVIQMTQADQNEATVPFLGADQLVQRNDEDPRDMFVLAPDHPLLAELPTRDEANGMTRLVYPTVRGRHGNWEAIHTYRGVQVLVSSDAFNRRVAMTEAEVGAGRVINTTFYCDQLYDADGNSIVPDEAIAFGNQFARNIATYTWLVQAGDAPAVTPTAPYVGPHGPMVGYVTDTTAWIWTYAGPDSHFAIEYWPAEDGQSLPTDAHRDQAERQLFHSDADQHDAAKIQLTGLAPLTRYVYDVTPVDADGNPLGPVAPEWSVTGREARMIGSFRTAPTPGDPARFKMALSSCMHPGGDQYGWYMQLAQNVDFQMLLGDTTYADTQDREIIWDWHLEYRRTTPFATVLRNTPTVAMWDDHDYGPNNSGGEEPRKAESLRAWSEVWCNPYLGTDELPGAFYDFRYGDVHFIVVDGRYYRTNPSRLPGDHPDKRMLGDEQMAWLQEKLRSSDAPFKVIASGSTLDFSRNDGWHTYEVSRTRLYNFLAEEGIDGVFYLSGDIHQSLIAEHDFGGDYLLPEVISSGITRSSQLGFATIEFDTTADDPTARVQVIHGDGSITHDRTFRLSEMTSADAN